MIGEVLLNGLIDHIVARAIHISGKSVDLIDNVFAGSDGRFRGFHGFSLIKDL